MRRVVNLLQSLPKDAETVKLHHFLFAFRQFRFLRRHWRGCGVPVMFMLTRDTFSTSFSIVFWGRAGTQCTPSISRVTVNPASSGISASGERSWYPFQKRDVCLPFCVCLPLFCLSVIVCLTVPLSVCVHQCLAALACVFLCVFLGCVCLSRNSNHIKVTDFAPKFFSGKSGRNSNSKTCFPIKQRLTLLPEV